MELNLKQDETMEIRNNRNSNPFNRIFYKGFAIVQFVLISNLSAQSSIVASGNETYTIGEVFPIMQTIQEEKEVTLSTPKFEIPMEQPKPIVKKKTAWQKFIEAILKLFK